MKNNRRSSSSTSDDLFGVSAGMDSDVSDAAKILRSFVSQVDPGEQAQDSAVEQDMFPIGAKKVDKADESSAKEPPTVLDQYIESASEASDALDEDVPRITPRIVTQPEGDAKLDDLRLVYKGKATKRQLDKLRRKVMQQAQSRSSLQAVPGSSEK
ncbi:MAG: hypothetical protein EP343_20555 [Deltaproteobacteria bacterium]|nr:MAG: hypothetical protein EP343_20555 [Deltaproteobacteria bacterium]